MLIGIDASRATKSFKRGPEQYSFYLIKALAAIDSQNQYILYSPQLPDNELSNLSPNFQWKIIPFFRFWTQVRLSWEMLKNPPDVLFIPSHVMPVIHPKKTILTIHDLGYKHYPEVYTPFACFYENFALKFLVKSAAKIITPSLATKKDLIKFVGIDPKKITVIYHGFDQELYKPKKDAKSAFPYLLFLGRLEAKKNIIGLINAYRILRKDSKIKHKLVLIGQPGYQYQKIKQAINSLPAAIKKDILQLGYLPTKEAATWMKGASAFVFPSFFEGFGISVIEAMASGVPVVVSSILALKEVGGDAALFVNPKSSEEIAKGIRRVILEEKLREDLIKKGLKRAKEFSWQKCAVETLRVLEEVGENKV
jgi:glycosyltransferase involved in cell wall biosynthesis